MSDELDEARVLDVAARYAAATNSGDLDRLRSLHATGAVVWHNFDEHELPLERSLETLVRLRRVAPDASFDEIRHTATSDGFVQRAVLCATAPDGSRVRAPSCIVATLDPDARIVRVEEYLDPSPLSRLAEPAR